MNSYYADLHIHIGRTMSGKPVKISAAKDLTFTRIAETAALEKGLDLIGIIDCHVPEVQEEIEGLIRAGCMKELPGGGLSFRTTAIILGAEIEVKDEGYRPVHYLCYLPTLERMKRFTRWLKEGMRNVSLSSQRLNRSSRELQQKVKELDGLFVPAHIFTPYKGIYGSVAASMGEILHLEEIDGVELGLSGNTAMADTIAELAAYTFLTNSDAHSLGKIAREYQRIAMKEPSFAELKKALERQEGRKVEANYGLKPQLGKYHMTVCLQCGQSAEGFSAVCPFCGGTLLKGVAQRIRELGTFPQPQHPPHRPPYIEQVPLEFLPGVGKKTYRKLIARYGSEMNVLHRVPAEDIRAHFGEQLALLIEKSRKGKLEQIAGGGGVYGKIRVP